MNQIKDKILITGGKGFIGSALNSYLGAKGYEIREFNGEIRNVETLEPYFKDIKWVVHLAAKTFKNSRNREPSDYFDVNLYGTLDVIRLCLKYDCRLIYFSSTEALIKRDDYGMSKALAEELIEYHAAKHNLKAETIRPCGIYGPDDPDNNRYIVRRYPLAKLCQDVANIISKYNFDRYRVYSTKLFVHKIYPIKLKLYLIKKFIKSKLLKI